MHITKFWTNFFRYNQYPLDVWGKGGGGVMGKGRIGVTFDIFPYLRGGEWGKRGQVMQSGDKINKA